jgi:hypothetical protein
VSTPLESRSVWAEIQSLLSTESIPVLAQRFHVRPGEIAEAIKRSGFHRKAVTSAAAAEEGAPAEAPPAAGPPAPRKESKVAPYRHLLGVQTDGAIAKLAGVVAETVRMYRVRQGISPAAQDQAHPRAEAGSDRSAPEGRGSAPAGRARAPAGDAQAPAKRGPGRPRKERPEGEVPAPSRREKAAAKEAAAATPARRGVPSPIDAHVHLLGKMTDADLAHQIGVTRGAVYQYRRHRKIPAFLPKVGKGDEAAPAPKAAAKPAREPEAAPREAAAPARARAPAPAVERAPAPSTTSANKAPLARSAWAYTVTVRRGEIESTYAVLGKDLADAASRAVGAVEDGEVINISRYLESLG